MSKILFFTLIFMLIYCVNGAVQPDFRSLTRETQYAQGSNLDTTDATNSTVESKVYHKFMEVSETKFMPELSFELTGDCQKDDCTPNYYYYPVKLIIKINKKIIQEIEFEDVFAPCDHDDFSFEYGDYRFDGYGGFRLLHTSMGQNPDFFFWMWDNEKQQFVEYPDLNISGYMTFDYNKEEVHVASTASATYHEFDTYKYIDNKLTLVEKIVDQDTDGFRKVYKLIDGKLKLVETTESQLKG